MKLLPQSVGARLLRLARNAIMDNFGQTVDAGGDDASPLLDETRGAFVTLRKQGRLRGCIGRLSPEAPLRETIPDVAVLAATEDPRFPPVLLEEMHLIDIHLSILTPAERLGHPDPKAVQVGRHGLWLCMGQRQGVLLPEVATRFEWTSEEFLAQTCRKAKLPPDAWQAAECEVYRFETQSFAEEGD